MYVTMFVVLWVGGGVVILFLFWYRISFCGSPWPQTHSSASSFPVLDDRCEPVCLAVPLLY